MRKAAYHRHRLGSFFKLLNPLTFARMNQHQQRRDQKTAALAKLANTSAASYNNKTTTNSISPSRCFVQVPNIPTFRHAVRVMMKTIEKRFQVRITPRFSHICRDNRAHLSIRRIVLLILLPSFFSTLACCASTLTVNDYHLLDWS